MNPDKTFATPHRVSRAPPLFCSQLGSFAGGTPEIAGSRAASSIRQLPVVTLLAMHGTDWGTVACGRSRFSNCSPERMIGQFDD